MAIPYHNNPLGLFDQIGKQQTLIPLTFVAQQNYSSITIHYPQNYTSTDLEEALEYRVNVNGEWKKVKNSSDSYSSREFFLDSVGDFIQIRCGQNTFIPNTDNYMYFSMTGKIAAYGSIQSLLNDSNSTEKEYAFYRLFKDCTSLTKAPELTAQILTPHCYQYMFQGCTNLLEAPKLPAVNIAEYCYTSMFYRCTNLSSAPKLPATSLQSCCYYRMFMFCENLIESAEMMATVLNYRCCYYMYYGCTGLRKAHKLLAQQLTQQCYQSMFADCPFLGQISVNFKKWRDDIRATDYWFDGNASIGTFYKPSELLEQYGYSYIPFDWSVVQI